MSIKKIIILIFFHCEWEKIVLSIKKKFNKLFIITVLIDNVNKFKNRINNLQKNKFYIEKKNLKINYLFSLKKKKIIIN